MSECKLYGRNRPDMYLFTHEQILSTVNEAYSYGEQGIDMADFRIECEDFGTKCEGHRCEETDEWVCHKCGGSLVGCMFDPVRDGFVCVPNFCPSCGTKVASDDDTYGD